MTVVSKEFNDIIASFEKDYSHMRLDKEQQESWKDGNIFQNGDTDNAFKLFRHGYALGRARYMMGAYD